MKMNFLAIGRVLWWAGICAQKSAPEEKPGHAKPVIISTIASVHSVHGVMTLGMTMNTFKILPLFNHLQKKFSLVMQNLLMSASALMTQYETILKHLK
jgi:hypothetical protein